jgi:hypothetical protein
MAKVIVERPRLGGGVNKPKGYRRRLQRLAIDDLPRREGIRLCWGAHRKYFNEHLGPLRRYLNSQVGRPWNLVFSEICRHISRNSVVQDHLRDHVLDYVQVHVIEIDGVPCYGAGYRYGTPLRSRWGTRFFVCPRTRLLKRLPLVRRPRRRRTAPHDVVRVSDELLYRKIDGVWYEVRTAPMNAAAHGQWDVVLKKLVFLGEWEQAWRTYGAYVYGVSKRQLNKREIRRMQKAQDR